jgi:hypothetical protein
MQTSPPRPPHALTSLEQMVGREEPLYALHGALLRAAHALRPVVESGTLLATCSDEFNGEIRAAFERDVARVLTAPHVPATRRVFSVSNLGGRIEPGAIALLNQHFTARSLERGHKLLLIEIAGHVGRREVSGSTVWGELDRFGNPSPCCGALQLLLHPTPSAEAVRFPWFDQLTAFFGAERLAALRADTSPWRMARAAVVHAVLQAETAIVDLLREPPPTPTHVLLCALVAVNRRGQDSSVPVGVHHLVFEHGLARFEHGVGLRSTPGALRFEERHGRLQVEAPFDSFEEHAPPAVAPALAAGLHSPELGELARSERVHAQLERARQQFRSLAPRPQVLRIYARPLLRALLQGLSVLAPEVGLAAMALEGGRDLFRAQHLKKLLAGGPSTAAARAALHDLEPTIQQLSHHEAREVLELLLSEQHPLFARRR